MKNTLSIKRILMVVLIAAACTVVPTQPVHAATPTVQVKLGNKVVKKNLYVKKTLQIITKNGNTTVKKNKVKYKSSSKAVATVSKNGVIKAKKPGTAIITVKYGSKKAKIKIMVYRPVTKIKLNRPSWTAETTKIGMVLKATCTPKNASSRKSVTWTSSNTKVARVDKYGFVTAVGKGSCVITATPAWPASSKVKATCKVTVKNNWSTYDLDTQDGDSWETWIEDSKTPVDSITLSKTTASVQEGSTITLTATIKPSNATDQTVTWSSDNTAIAKVSNGKVTGVKPGITVIRAKAESAAAACAVTVTAKPSSSTVSTTVTVGGVVWDISHAKATTNATETGTDVFYVQPKSTVNPSDVTYAINGGTMLRNGTNAATGLAEACVPNSKQLIAEVSYGHQNNIYKITAVPGCVTGSFTAAIRYKGQTVASTKFVTSKASDWQVRNRVWANAIGTYLDSAGANLPIDQRMTYASEWIATHLSYSQADCQGGVEILAIVARDAGYQTAFENVTGNLGVVKRSLHLTSVFIPGSYHAKLHIYNNNDHIFALEAQGHI